MDLHANFTAVWQSYGWLPEAYSIDTQRINPEDPGYNLRPEHVESTYLLYATTGNPVYLKTARSLLHVRLWERAVETDGLRAVHVACCAVLWLPCCRILVLARGHGFWSMPGCGKLRRCPTAVPRAWAWL